MKFFLSILITGILSFIVGLYAPWWSLAIVAFFISLLIPKRPLSSFISGFVGVFFMWWIVASFINARNNNIMANKIGEMFGIGHNPLMLLLITAFVGGLVAGFAALTASYLRK